MFISTRGKAPSISYPELIISGTAPDKGLYVLKGGVRVGHDFLRELQDMSYAEKAARLISLYTMGSPFSEAKLNKITAAAYTAEKFRHVRPGEDPARIVQTRNLWGDTYLVSLANGPTLAFKDMAMQFHAPMVMEALKHFRMDFYTILLGTSGDTGSAAIEAFRQYPNVNMFVMAGGAGITDFQLRQMTTTREKQIHCMFFPNFDMTQGLLKQVFEDRDFVSKVNLGAVNSVNLNRLLAQMVYTFSAYLDVVDEIGEEIDVVVPSGNFGDAHSVYMAKLMGLPIRHIVIATNENDVLHQVIENGVYQKSDKVTPTLSPSMDIKVASNFERTLWYALDRKSARIRELYQEFEGKGRFELSQEEHKKLRDAGFRAVVCDEQNCLLTMGQVHHRTEGLKVDPHTAVGIFASAHSGDAHVKKIVFETAREFKFLDAVERAIGLRPTLPIEFEEMFAVEPHYDTINNMTDVGLKKYMLDRLSV